MDDFWWIVICLAVIVYQGMISITTAGIVVAVYLVGKVLEAALR